LTFRRFPDGVNISKVWRSGARQFCSYQVVAGKKGCLQCACRVYDIFNAPGPCGVKIHAGYFREDVNGDGWVAHMKERAGFREVGGGDGSLVAAERNFIADVRTRALDLKAKGMPADDAGKQISADLKAKYTDWPNTNVAGFVRSIYAEK